MIKRLQIKFIVVILAVVSALLLIVLSATAVSVSVTSERQAYQFMRDVADYDGHMPTVVVYKEAARAGSEDKINKQNPSYTITASDKRGKRQQKNFVMSNPYFSVLMDHDDTIIDTVYSNGLNYTEEEVREFISGALTAPKPSGKLDNYRFLVAPKPYGKIIVFWDNNMQTKMLYHLIITSVGVFAISLFIVFLIALFLSSWAIKPVKKAFESQKQFVADASHELKTPLTIISANADVLEGEIGQNKWLTFIKEETQRMNLLVHDLLYLAKNDSDEQTRGYYSLFDFSRTVDSAALAFESLVFENSQSLTMEIEPNVMLTGDEGKIKQLVAILLDNAVKHTPSGGDISITLKVCGNKKTLTVLNTGEGIEEDRLERIFERFYRSDSSRARETGGYGLGLSIARAIVTEHGGKITADSTPGAFASFTVTL